jgi:hypothetical protein
MHRRAHKRRAMSHNGVGHIGGGKSRRANLTDPKLAYLRMSEPTEPNKNCNGSNSPRSLHHPIAPQPSLQSHGRVNRGAAWRERTLSHGEAQEVSRAQVRHDLSGFCLVAAEIGLDLHSTISGKFIVDIGLKVDLGY